MNVLANVILFLSTLLLLIDIAPRDLLPSHRREIHAVTLLKEHKNIVKPLPNTNFKFDSGSGYNDADAFGTLQKLIQQYSLIAEDVPWQRAVGIGYSVINLPVATNNLEAFHPLYVATLPLGDGTVLNLIPVGQIGDMNTWLQLKHQGSLSATAIVLLSVGFLLQMIGSFRERRKATQHQL